MRIFVDATESQGGKRYVPSERMPKLLDESLKTALDSVATQMPVTILHTAAISYSKWQSGVGRFVGC
jgi:hypothetical protein